MYQLQAYKQFEFEVYFMKVELCIRWLQSQGCAVKKISGSPFGLPTDSRPFRFP